MLRLSSAVLPKIRTMSQRLSLFGFGFPLPELSRRHILRPNPQTHSALHPAMVLGFQIGLFGPTPQKFKPGAVAGLLYSSAIVGLELL